MIFYLTEFMLSFDIEFIVFYLIFIFVFISVGLCLHKTTEGVGLQGTQQSHTLTVGRLR